MKIQEHCSRYIASIPTGVKRVAKFGFSLVVIGAGTLLAKNIYDLSLQVLKNSVPFPYDQFFALGCGVISTAYLSFRITASAMTVKEVEVTKLAQANGETPKPTEIVAAQPVEGELKKTV